MFESMQTSELYKLEGKGVNTTRDLEAPLSESFSEEYLAPFIIDWQRRREEAVRDERNRPRLTVFEETEERSSEND